MTATGLDEGVPEGRIKVITKSGCAGYGRPYHRGKLMTVERTGAGESIYTPICANLDHSGGNKCSARTGRTEERCHSGRNTGSPIYLNLLAVPHQQSDRPTQYLADNLATN